MYAWEAIQNSLNYIEAHLTEEMDISLLSMEAALSPYYFQRLFRKLVKLPVNDYIRLRRLAAASEELKNNNRRILETALDYQFSGHANFTRAFREAYGITPEEFRKHPVFLNHYAKPDLSMRCTAPEEDTGYISDGILIEVKPGSLEKARVFLGMEGEVPVSELSPGRDTGVATAGILWEAFHREKPNIVNILPMGSELGVISQKKVREGCCNYFAGTEVQNLLDSGKYASFLLPAGEYIICRFEAESYSILVGSAMVKALTFMKYWLKRHNLSCTAFAAEMYFPSITDTCLMELWFPLDYASGKASPMTGEKWDKLSQSQKPDMEALRSYVNNPLWDRLIWHIEAEYRCKPILEYSKCSMQKGWNIKYKKAGRSLCTLYPMEGVFIVLVVIGEKERNEMEFMLPACTKYLQQLYQDTKTGMGQKWLMIQVSNEAILNDVRQCIAIRRGAGK